MKAIIFILISVAISINGQVLKLDLGDRQIEMYINILTSWENAFQACASRDMELLTIQSIEENYNIVAFLNSNEITGNVWTAGSDLYETGIFRWMINGEKLSVDFWADGQPDNYGGREHCLYFFAAGDVNANVNWFDGVCSSAYRYFCQTKITTVPAKKNIIILPPENEEHGDEEDKYEPPVKESQPHVDSVNKIFNYRTNKWAELG